MAVGLGKAVGEGVWLGTGEAVGGRVTSVGARVAVSGGGNVPQEVSRMSKISHCNVRVFIIVNLLVIIAERYASIATKPGRFSLVGYDLLRDKN